MEKIKSYYSQSKLELAKVIFPTKEQVRSAFIAVFLVVFIISLFLALIDLLMSFVVSNII